MKVLNVNFSLDPVSGGGTVERTFQMSRLLSINGIKCIVLTTDLGLTPEHIKAMEGAKIIALPCIFKRFYIPKFSYRAIKDIVADADIIHLMGHWTLINALVYFIARRINKPYVVCPAGALQIYGRSQIIKRLYNLVIGKKIICNANGHIAITADEINKFKPYGVDIDKVSVIPNGIDEENLKTGDIAGFRKKYKLGDNPFIMFMGRLNSIKGPDLLLHAFCNIKNRFHDFHLVFAGPDGGMLDELKRTVAEFGVGDRVHFIGYLGGEDKSNAYYAADIVVIPSRHEAMSIVVLEAGITGTPVLLTDRCGFNEVETVNGGKVVPASVEGLQRGLIEMLSDKVRLKLMGENLKNHITENFTWDMLIDKYLIFYKKILDFKVM